MDKNQYWPNELTSNFPLGVLLEIRANIALNLIEHFGSIASKIEGEDSAGRAKLLLQEPQELVDRCFLIAELFVQQSEEKGLLKVPSITDEDKAIHSGKIERIKINEAYKREEKTVTS